MNFPNITPLHHFHFWCQKVLPLVYDDSLSYQEVLCKLTSFINTLITNEDELTQFIKNLQGDMDGLKSQWDTFQKDTTDSQEEFEIQINDSLAQMQQVIDDIESGKNIDLYINYIKAYVDQNLQEMVAGIVKYVVFGLSADGHFVAYIPTSWNFLHFSTIVDPNSELYNHLVLMW